MAKTKNAKRNSDPVISRECLEFQPKFEKYLKEGILPEGFSTVKDIQDYLETLTPEERKNMRSACDFKLKPKDSFEVTALVCDKIPSALLQSVGCATVVGAAAYLSTHDITATLGGTATGLLWLCGRYCHIRKSAEKTTENKHTSCENRLKQFENILPKSPYYGN